MNKSDNTNPFPLSEVMRFRELTPHSLSAVVASTAFQKAKSFSSFQFPPGSLPLLILDFRFSDSEGLVQGLKFVTMGFTADCYLLLLSLVYFAFGKNWVYIIISLISEWAYLTNGFLLN